MNIPRTSTFHGGIRFVFFILLKKRSFCKPRSIIRFFAFTHISFSARSRPPAASKASARPPAHRLPMPSVAGLHDISIRHGTDPASVLLSPGNDAFDFLRRIRDRHFIGQKTQANIGPIVMRRIIDAVPDGATIRTPASRKSSSSTSPRELRRENRLKSLMMRISYCPVIRYGRIR